MCRTDVRPIPNRRALSEWLTRSALSRSTSSALSDAGRGRPCGRPSLLPGRFRRGRVRGGSLARLGADRQHAAIVPASFSCTHPKRRMRRQFLDRPYYTEQPKYRVRRIPGRRIIRVSASLSVFDQEFDDRVVAGAGLDQDVGGVRGFGPEGRPAGFRTRGRLWRGCARPARPSGSTRAGPRTRRTRRRPSTNPSSS